jgi:acetyl-CoA carboxylase biotin carboxylase subunit
MKRIDKVLVANRGEIAVRIIKTLRKMGIRSVAVYSEADQYSPHVYLADEAVCIGPPPSSQSYLNAQKIIAIAKEKNVDAIHPGYGFLSENPSFAEMLEENDIKLIGPSAESMRIMGNKLSAKEAVKQYTIPLVLGTDYALSDKDECIKVANQIGYPLLIKAAAGGGGKGMRLVHKEEEVEDQLNMAMSEALSSFGDASVFIEKFVTRPRHIEFQILADEHGNVAHLFERECSIQRRHQKVIEEAPSSILSPELRNQMGDAAIKVARSCSYHGAGTVEFLLDENNNFYFLEMNTRLQVEHPVTEMITGLDLVEWQIKVARGEQLTFTQQDLTHQGHAIELRVYAEDPTNNFLPSINKLARYKEPAGNGIRVDSGFTEGMDIPIYYDPMLSKLIVYADTRNQAIYKMINAIHNYEIEGIANTLDLGTFVMNHPDFVSGQFDTNFLAKNWKGDYADQNILTASAAFIESLNK